MMANTDPFSLFESFYNEALTLPLNEPTAMTLATAGEDGRPSARIVLLKRYSPEEGFVFFTNKDSRKAGDLHHNPFAALCFHRDETERQVRIEGAVKPLSDEENDAYFAGRPRLSKLGAWASQQSRPLDKRETLENRLKEFDLKFAEQEPPRPAYWGGYRLTPDRFEFWKNVPGRLHERRFFFRETPTGDWRETLLYP